MMVLKRAKALWRNQITSRMRTESRTYLRAQPAQLLARWIQTVMERIEPCSTLRSRRT